MPVILLLPANLLYHTITFHCVANVCYVIFLINWANNLVNFVEIVNRPIEKYLDKVTGARIQGNASAPVITARIALCYNILCLE